MNNKITILLLLALFYGITLKAQTPVSPSDGATDVIQTTSTISWTAFDDGNGNGPYDFVISTNASFTPPFAEVQTLLGVPSASITTILPNSGTVYWQVRDSDIDGVGSDGIWHQYSFSTEKVQTTSPTDGATGVAIGSGLNITWAAFRGNVYKSPNGDATQGNYDFELHSNGTYTGLLESFSNQASASVILTTSLSAATTYYWRIRDTDVNGNGVDDGAGDNGNWQNYSFTTLSLNPPPGSTSPVDLATGVSLTPTISWDNFQNPDPGTDGDYNFELRSASGGGGTLIASASNITSASPQYVVGTDLAPLTTYYWRVQDEDAPAVWHEFSFTTGPVTGITIADGAVSVPASTSSISWDAFIGSATDVGNGNYDFEIYLDNFITLWDDDLNTASTTTNFSFPLYAGVTYYWRVRDTDNDGLGGNGPWSEFSFTVATSSAPPANTTPADAATGVSDGITSINWATFDNGFGPGNYDFQLATDAGFTNVIDNQTNLGTSSATLSVSLANTANVTYYWRVRDTDIDGIGGDGGWHSFSFTIAPATAISPADGASGVSIATTQASWNAFIGAYGDATSGNYDFEIDDDPGFGSSELVTNTSSPAIFTTVLASSTTYYWRVRDTDSDGNASDDGGSDNGPWSTFNFTTAAPPSQYPPNGGTDIPVDFGTATFLPSVGTAPYDIQLSTSIGFGTLLLDIVDHPTTSVTFPNPLAFNTTYYWRVRDVSNGAWTVYSFKTIDDYQAYLASPVNMNANVEPINVPFSWFFNGNYNFNIKFYLVYGTDSNLSGADTVKNIASLGNSGIYHMRMDPGTLYYWRIISIKNNQMVAFSPINSFTTRGAAAVPEIAHPDNGTTVYLNSPILWWYSLNFHIFHDYEVEWDDNPGFTSPDTIKNIHSVFTYLSGLSGGQTYYWRVRSFNNGIDTSGWSDVAYFETFDVVTASIPSPAYPTGGVEVYSLFPRLFWVLNGPSQGLTYEVRYGLNLSGNNVDVSGILNTDYWIISNISQLFVTLYNGVEGGGTYYWQVRSYNGVTYSNWSDYAEFSIYNFSADLIPILSWPIGGNLVYSTDVNFAWHVEGSSLGKLYEIDYAENVNPGIGDDIDGTPELSNLTSNLLTIPLTAGKKYEWRVRVVGETTWSNVETFEVIGAGGANVPVLNWPVGGATVWSNSQDLSWTLVGGGSPTYRVEVFTNPSLTAHFAGSPFTAVAGSPLTISGLAAGTTYYWRVRVEPSEPWSNVEVFTVFAGISPAVPLAASPSQGIELTSSKATLSWFTPTYSDQSVKYEVEYANNIEMSNAVIVTDLSNPRFEANGLSGGTYFWRTRSKTNNGKYSEYSDIAEFKITGITDLESEEVLPQKYELSQNYPNPFNPTTAIKYNLPESNYVTLKIYNMLGQEIRTLVSGQANAGSYNVVWNGKDNFGHNVSSGAYIYQIVAGNFVQTRKMILLK